MSNSASTANIRLKKGLKFKAIMAFGFIFLIVIGCLFNPYRLKMTMTESVNHSVFIVDTRFKNELKVDQYVTVKSPANPRSGQEFVKLIAGVEGDVVRVEGRDIYVGGIFRGKAKELSKSGRALEVIQSGVIPKGYIYIFAPHIDSYDSRYSEIGFVSKSTITGHARPLL